MTDTILIVEDDPAIAEVLAELLELDGYTSMALDDPVQVEDIIARVQPRLILMDLMLPGTTGIELAESLQANGLAGTPMIALSASPLMLDVARASGLFHDTLPKPFDADAVLDTVAEHLPLG